MTVPDVFTVLGTTERKTWKAALRRAFLPRSLSLRLIWRVVLTPAGRELAEDFHSFVVFVSFSCILTVFSPPCVNRLVLDWSISKCNDLVPALVFDSACLTQFSAGSDLSFFPCVWDCWWFLMVSLEFIPVLHLRFLKEKHDRYLWKINNCDTLICCKEYLNGKETALIYHS